jgi:hypothetical protein
MLSPTLNDSSAVPRHREAQVRPLPQVDGLRFPTLLNLQDFVSHKEKFPAAAADLDE